MTQKAVVKHRLGGGRVAISIPNTPGCTHNCASCAGCGTAGGRTPAEAVAKDDLGADPGRWVVVEPLSGKHFSPALLLYLLPFGGLFLAYWLTRGLAEGTAAFLSIAVFFAVLLGVTLPLDRYVRRHKTVTFRVVALGD